MPAAQPRLRRRPLVLRYGALYGPNTGMASPTKNTAALHVDAAAHAALLALSETAHGIFNIAEPSPHLSIDRALTELGWQPNYRLPG